MKRESNPTILIASLVGLLAVASAMLWLGRSENQANPDSLSYSPSGTRAFAQLLLSQGYEVRSIAQTRFRIPKDTLAVALVTRGSMENPAENDAFEHALRAHVEAGGRALVAYVPNDYRRASLHALEGPATIIPANDGLPGFKNRSALKVSVDSHLDARSSRFFVFRFESEATLWNREGEGRFAAIFSVGEGICLVVYDGLGLTNRFLDREDNASFFLQSVALLARPGSEVAFLEAAHSPGADPSLMELMGPWAVAGWNQMLVLFALVILTLGIRFGEPERLRSAQRGARELADAVASLFQRGKATDVALDSLAKDADRRLRSHLKIPRDATKEKRNARLPDRLASALAKAEFTGTARTPTSVAISVAKELERELTEFIGPKARAPKRRKI